ncbi:recombinase family protein [Thalassococcus sp. S3]|uniref:recombinase family protein n=1 Tax=Thalassococcus sp. S3 TaxID=2017482 RepID=UPI0010247A6C|nr:recombinase family protein [Thalassococcus sp. S3]QBF32336.1 resolvase [Thalassococcus sp. S3]
MPKPRRIGYVRVSTERQQVDRQILQLEAICDELRVEKLSAVAAERPVFDALLRELAAGDTFVVVDIDRAFRSAIDAILTAGALEARGVTFEVLTFPMSTTSDEGEFMYGVLALAAQFERRIIRRRTKEGLAAARRRGVRLGRPSHLQEPVIREAYAWMVEIGLPCRYVAALLGVSRLTLQRGFHRLELSYPIPPKPPKGDEP